MFVVYISHLQHHIGDQKVLDFQTFYILNFWIKGAQFLLQISPGMSEITATKRMQQDNYELRPAQVT